MKRVLRLLLAVVLSLITSTALFRPADAQQRRAAPAAPPATAKAAAPIDITGHWVSLITDDWVYRMITPAKGDVSYVPLNPEGPRVGAQKTLDETAELARSSLEKDMLSALAQLMRSAPAAPRRPPEVAPARPQGERRGLRS